MRALDRNKQTLYYALYTGLTEVTDDNGFYTGQDKPSYTDPVKVRMNISTARGEAFLQPYGISDDYTHALVTSDMKCPIDEHSILWLGIEPVVDGNTVPHNFVVTRVARSLNSITYLIRAVDES